MPGSGLGDRDARADRQGGELIDGGTAGAPVGKLLFVELRGHMRVPLADYRPHHRAGVEPAAIDTHRAVEASADLEGRLDDGVARQARQNGFEIRDCGAGRRAIPFLLVRSGCDRGDPYSMRANGPHVYCMTTA